MNHRKIFNAIVMVTGTSVGSGILGLPIITSTAGLVPTLLAFVIAWVFMTLGAYCILDIKMQLRGPFNLSSLIKHTLGRSGQYVSSLMIMLLLYALLCTYTMAGGAWFSLFMRPFVHLSGHCATLLFTVLFGGLLCCGEKLTYHLNNVLGIGLLIAFVATVSSSLSPASYDFVGEGHFNAILPSLPLILTTFGFSIVVPALTEYLDYDEKSVKVAIISGSLVALAAYAVWEWVTLGHIPLDGALSFQSMKQAGDNGTGVIVALAQSTTNRWVAFAGQWFAIFAVVTSFLGVSLALLHFLADTMTLKCQGRGRWILFLMTYLPPLMVTRFYPQAFVQILSFAGIFVAILLGLFPVWMVFKNRGDGMNLVSKQRVFLMGGAFFFAVVIVQEVMNLL